MNSDIEILKKIRIEAEKHLPEDVIISDNVYRPFDMGVFGKKGYCLTLYKSPNKMLGVNFGDSEPSVEFIKKQVQKIIDTFNT